MPSAEQKKSLERAVAHYQQFLSDADSYLSERGIPRATAESFRLGVVKEPLTGHEHLHGRLAIPYLTITGVVDIRFRSMDGSDPKYMGLPGAKTHLFNVSSVLISDNKVAVTEGEVDTITLATMGIHAVGVPGVSNWKPHYSRILQDFEEVFVFADGDQAGRDFSKRLARDLDSVTIINCPEGEDVNSVFTKFGADWFMEKING